MNPNIDKFPMPNTGPTGANMQGGEFGAPNRVMEQMPSKEANSFAPLQPAIPAAPVLASDMPNPQVTPPPVARTVTPAPGIPQVTGTGEELERKWIAVAKTIVERTRDNPFLQSQELSKAGKEFRKQTGRGINQSEE